MNAQFLWDHKEIFEYIALNFMLGFEIAQLKYGNNLN